MSFKHDDPREGGGWVRTKERRYHFGSVFVKRTLRPKEFVAGPEGVHVPRLNKERLMNEAQSLRYIRQHTNIPVPRVYGEFEEDGAYYLVTESVSGWVMSDFWEDQKAKIREELQSHLASLKALKSNQLGGPSGMVLPPYRVMQRTDTDQWSLRPSDRDEYVFCHNDLSQQNIIADPVTLKIKAIVDWEYAGFYPPQFEYPTYNRLGRSVSVNGEHDDSLELLEFLKSQVNEPSGDIHDPGSHVFPTCG